MAQAIKLCVFCIWLVFCLLHGALLLLAIFTTRLQDTLFEGVGVTVLMVPYLLHQLGVPVLQDERVGWGMQLPNMLGWFSAALVWVLVYWFVAVGVCRLIGRCKGVR